MTATNNTEFAAMGKEELRAACRTAGVSYSKLNNDGMRAALAAHYATDESVEDEAVAGPNPFAAMMGGVVVPAFKGNVTKSSDGKKVKDEEVVAPKATPVPRVVKPAAPFVPKVVRKDYKIQKDREVRVLENGKTVKRPSEGTVCGAVWAEFDKNPKITAGELHTLADSKGWNRTNVSCEFYTWRKFMGIKGRQA